MKSLKSKFNLNSLYTIIGWSLGIFMLYKFFLYPVFFSDNYLSELQGPEGKHQVYSGKSMELSEAVLKGIIVTKQPIAYERNRPNNSDVGDYIRWNSNVAYYEDRRLLELYNSCTNCMGDDRLITPRRVGYIKPGTRFKVLNKFFYRNEDIVTILVPNSPNYYYIVKDIDSGLRYEVRDFDLEDIIEGKPLSRKKYHELVVETVSGMKDGEWNDFEYCFSSTYYSEVGIKNFIDDFKIADEIRFDLKNKRKSGKHTNCLEMSFKSIEAYLTLRYYYQEWGGSSVLFRKLRKAKKEKGVSPRLLKN